MENCFDRVITFFSKTFDGSSHVKATVQKTATFQELDTTVKPQHRLHFLMSSIFKPGNTPAEGLKPGEKVNAKLDPDVLYDLTVKAIQVLLVDTPGFGAQDKEEFLADSGALMDFGLWFLNEKVFPFFPQLMRK